MIYKIFADIIVVTHFIWILFMIVGFLLTISAFGGMKKFFDKWLFRTLHLCGIAYVTLLAILGKYCPLTIWESNLRLKHVPSLTYPGSFIAHYIEMVVYPNVNPLIILLPTIFIAVFSLSVFIFRPPRKIKEMFYP